MKPTYLPVSLNINTLPIVMIGGGKVSLHKLEALLRFTNNITVIAKEILPEVKKKGLNCIEKIYSPEDLEGFGIIYACTNDRVTNAAIRGDAKKRGLLVNVADDPELCDFISPAIYKKDAMTVAVSSGGTDVRKAVAWRNKIGEWLDSE